MNQSIHDIIQSHLVNQNSFILGDGKSNLEDCVQELNLFMKDRMTSIVSNVSVGINGEEVKPIWEVIKGVLLTAIRNSNL